jgi:hypothetical protein
MSLRKACVMQDSPAEYHYAQLQRARQFDTCMFCSTCEQYPESMRSARSHLRPTTNSRLRVLIHQWTISSVLNNIRFSKNTVRATCEENVEVPQFGSPDFEPQLNEPYLIVSSRKKVVTLDSVP